MCCTSEILLWDSGAECETNFGNLREQSEMWEFILVEKMDTKTQ